MSERGTNAALIAVFSVLAVFFVAAVLLVAAEIVASSAGITKEALPASSYSLRHDH